MSKNYNTKEKLLIPIHQPTIHGTLDVMKNDKIMRKKRRRPSSWIPFRSEFYTGSDSDEDDDQKPKRNTSQSIGGYIKTPTSSISDIDEQELEWDETPEQFQLVEENNFDLEDMTPQLQPRRLFSEDEDQIENNTSGKTKTKHKLQRRNAMRRKRQNKPKSVPLIRTNRRRSSTSTTAHSYPNSPTDVKTNEVQHLNDVLIMNQPIVPAAVTMGSVVQRYGQVLENSDVRRSARIRANLEEQGRKPINYKRMHMQGSTEGTRP